MGARNFHYQPYSCLGNSLVRMSYFLQTTQNKIEARDK